MILKTSNEKYESISGFQVSGCDVKQSTVNGHGSSKLVVTGVVTGDASSLTPSHALILVQRRLKMVEGLKIEWEKDRGGGWGVEWNKNGREKEGVVLCA